MELNQTPKWIPSRMAWIFIAIFAAIAIFFFISEVISMRRRRALLNQLDKKKSEIKGLQDAALKAIAEASEQGTAAITAALDAKRPESLVEIATDGPVPNLPVPLAYSMPVIPAGLNFTMQPMPSSSRRETHLRAWANNQMHYVDVVNDPDGIHGDFRQKNDVYVPAVVFRLFDAAGVLLQESYIPTDANPDGKRIANEIRALLDSTSKK